MDSINSLNGDKTPPSQEEQLTGLRRTIKRNYKRISSLAAENLSLLEQARNLIVEMIKAAEDPQALYDTLYWTQPQLIPHVKACFLQVTGKKYTTSPTPTTHMCLNCAGDYEVVCRSWKEYRQANKDNRLTADPGDGTKTPCPGCRENPAHVHEINLLNAHVCEVARLRSLPYTEFLASAYWGRLRDTVLRHRDGVCGKCGSKNKVKAILKDRDMIGFEGYADVILLCKKCRKEVGDE